MTGRTAHCTCGRVTVVCSEEPVRTSICHCRACQRRTGSAFGVQARFAEDAVTVQGETSEYVRIGDGGARVTFRFCPTCSDTVCYTLDVFEGWLIVPVGLFADRDFPGPTASVYEDRQHPWLEVHGLVDRMR